MGRWLILPGLEGSRTMRNIFRVPQRLLHVGFGTILQVLFETGGRATSQAPTHTPWVAAAAEGESTSAFVRAKLCLAKPIFSFSFRFPPASCRHPGLILGITVLHPAQMRQKQNPLVSRCVPLFPFPLSAKGQNKRLGPARRCEFEAERRQQRRRTADQPVRHFCDWTQEVRHSACCAGLCQKHQLRFTGCPIILHPVFGTDGEARGLSVNARRLRLFLVTISQLFRKSGTNARKSPSRKSSR